MTKSKLNEQIALYFGFKKSKGERFLIHGHSQWTYPEDWYLAQGGIPNIDIPDFVQFLEDYLRLLHKHQHGGPREHFGS